MTPKAADDHHQERRYAPREGRPETASTAPAARMADPGRGIDADELEKFSRLARQWWDRNGPMRPLHAMNPARLSFIRDEALKALAADSVPEPDQERDRARPLAGLKILDVGCGGGLACEPLARMGARVTGLDASAEMVAAARAHAAGEGLEIDYRHTTAEALAGEGHERFDVVLALEIVEHVGEPAGFLEAAAALVRPGGLLMVSTINRTRKSWALAIVGAEYLLGWLPRGTHDWKRFLRPAEIAAALRPQGLAVTALAGMTYNPLGGDWRLSRDSDVNYILAARKPAEA